MSVKHVFQNLWDRFNSGRATATASEAGAPSLEETQRQLEEALAALDQRVVSFKKSHDIATVTEYTAEELADRAEAALKANADAMMVDIMREHERLGTGLTRERLDLVAARMTAMFANRAVPKSLPERLIAGVRERACVETGALAWGTLEQAMEKHGVEWPAPSGLGHSPTAERIAAVRKLEAARTRTGFIGHRATDVADLAHGYVRVWKSFYPEPGSGLYTETVLQAVGAGLWCFYAAAAQALVLRDRDGLEKKANEILSDGLTKLSDLLGRQAQIEPALKSDVTFRTQEIVADVIPAMVWAEIGARVAALKPDAETDALIGGTAVVAGV